MIKNNYKDNNKDFNEINDLKNKEQSKDVYVIKNALKTYAQQIKLEDFFSQPPNKVADITLQEGKVKFNRTIDAPIWNEKAEFIYIITVGKERYIVKIGGTAAGLRSRTSSYLAGRTKHRKKGTCATTNYQVLQFLKKIIENGKIAEMYAYKLESLPTQSKIVPSSLLLKGQNEATISIEPEIYHPYERWYIESYEKRVGIKPPLNQKAPQKSKH